MALLLKSGNFLHCIAGFTRHIIAKPLSQVGNVLQNIPVLGSKITRDISMNTFVKTDLSLESQLKRMDEDVRRTGRISRRDLDVVIEEIRNQNSATSSQSLLVIRCCGNLVPEEMPEVRTALAQDIWKTFKKLNVPMDISHYNALLRVYLENEHQFSPTDILADIQSSGIQPNRVTYQRLIARYCQDGDIEGATRILEYMREQKLPVNEHVFNSLIMGHSQANDMESAKGILDVMKQTGLEPSADTYTTLLCGYAKSGDIEFIEKTLQECEKNDIYLLDRDLLDIVYALAVNGHAEKTEALLPKLRISTGFNQDALNTILRLINKGYDDFALKLLLLMPRSKRFDGTPIDVGSFFVRQLVKANKPVEKIIKTCKFLEDEGLNSKAFSIAVESGLACGNVDKAFQLLHHFKESNHPIRIHYFWPLFCSAKPNEIVDIIMRIQNDFQMVPNAETLRDYIIPNLKEQNTDKLIETLRSAGFSTATAASSITYAFLTDNKISEAALVAESYKAYYPFSLFRQPLIAALNKTQDYDSFIRILRQICDSSGRTNYSENVSESEEGEEKLNNEQNDIVGYILNDVSNYFRSNRILVLENILSGLTEQGLSINTTHASRLKERLGNEITPTIANLLEKLSSGKLRPKPLVEKQKRTLDTLSIEELERFIVNVEGKNDNAINIKRQLLQTSFRTKNLEKTLEVMEKFEKESIPITNGYKAQLIELYCHHEKLSEALEIFEKIKEKDPNFVLDNLKAIRMADLMLKCDQFDDAIKFLEKNKKEELFTEGEGSYNYVSMCWRILNRLAEAGNVTSLQNMFDALVSYNYVIPTNIVLGPLIKVHIVNDDIQKAFETFESLCEKYQSTPWKNELACRLIQKEDAETLQKLTDLSTNIHGEVNSLYDLVFSFIECGRVRQARKILETPGLHTRPHRIETTCKRYKDEGMIKALEALMEATKDLHNIDRNSIFYNLLLCYCESEDAEKALGLWTKMQEEDVMPSDEFLFKLAELLKNKNIVIPFSVPQKLSEMNAPREGVLQTSTKSDSSKSDYLLRFKQAVKAENVDQAVKIKNEFKSNESLSVMDTSSLIELLCRADRLTEATKIVDELLSQGLFPKPAVFKFYLNKVSNTGDLQTINDIGNKITDNTKRLISYNNRACNAYINAGKSEEYLQSLINDIDNANSKDEIEKVATKFPRGGSLGILQKRPDLLPQFEQLANKHAAKNNVGPMNVIWLHLMETGKTDTAKAIFEKYLKNEQLIMFQNVVQSAEKHKNEELANNLVRQLETSNIPKKALSYAITALIDIQTENNKLEDALNSLNKALNLIPIEGMRYSMLSNLKNKLEASGKSFPYVLPEKYRRTEDSSSSSSSSSSDDDDDVTPKKPETQPKRAQSVVA